MRKALVIGASSEIGLEVVKELIRKDYHIFCTYYKNLNKIKILKKNNVKKIKNFKLFLKSLKSIKAFAYKINQTTKNIDLLILGANINSKRKEFMKINYKLFCEKINSNFLSYIFLIQLLIKNLLKKKKVKIIHISTLASKRGSWGLAEYSSSKAALDNVLKCIGFEYKNLDINSVYLGPVETKGYYFANKTNKKTKTKFITPKKAGLKIIKKI